MTDVLTCTIGGWRAARVAGVPYRTLDRWVRTGLLTCESPANGKGTRRGFSFLDLIRARAVAHLRRQGVSLQMIRHVLEALTEKWRVQDPLLQGRLVVAGDELKWVLDDKALLDALTGQLAATPLVILPVGEIVSNTREKVEALA